jgi:hypothetical protein
MHEFWLELKQLSHDVSQFEQYAGINSFIYIAPGHLSTQVTFTFKL